MIETAFVFDESGRVLHYHLPRDRTSGSIPDSRTLWYFLEKHVEVLGGVAHTHPGEGPPGPSREDVTTWSACELALGKRLLWPIANRTHTSFWRWHGPGPYDYEGTSTPLPNMEWGLITEGIDRLRVLSGMDDKD